MDKISKGARHAALQALERVVTGDAYAEIVLERALEDLNEPDKHLTTGIVYGVLRWQIKLDWIIDLFSTIKTKKLEDRVLNALRIGVYQLYFLTKIPASAAVNETVNLIRAEGSRTAGFVNAVLRKAAANKGSITYPDLKADPLRHLSVVYSHPEWIARRWIERYGLDEAIELAKANQMVPPKTIRVNTLVITRDDLLEELTKEGFEVRETGYSPDGVEVLKGGRLSQTDPRFYIQDEASQIVPYLLAPVPGERVLDACSAPGGKATHIAQMMRNDGVVYALDRYGKRLKSVDDAAKRLKINIIKTMEADAEAPIKFNQAASFDAILIDAPCSGLGVLRRSPDIKLKRKEEDIKELSGRQKRLLENISRYLKKGGRIVYSTCTFEPEETDDVIKDFLDKHNDFVLEDGAGYLPKGCEKLVDKSGLLRTYPHKFGMDGFFAARLFYRG